MTSRSSWWQSTAEGSGGLVCWLESLRALIAAAPGCDVVFIANSGHELGHLGLDDFTARRPGWECPMSEGGTTWIHFGADIGAAGGELLVQSANDDLRELRAAELTHAEQAPARWHPRPLRPAAKLVTSTAPADVTLLWPRAIGCSISRRIAGRTQSTPTS
jgi:hypothetical protein